MSYENSIWCTRKLFCPNCRHLVMGYEDKAGTTKLFCEKCGTSMVRKSMGRRHDRIDIFAPRGQERI